MLLQFLTQEWRIPLLLLLLGTFEGYRIKIKLTYHISAQPQILSVACHFDTDVVGLASAVCFVIMIIRNTQPKIVLLPVVFVRFKNFALLVMPACFIVD
jgi:hypothetical protein